jgi:MSHA pilin protein MshA
MTSKGFTLIELVLVIVVLGILATIAAPKFIDLSSDARKSVMQGLKGSLDSAIALAHAKAIVTNQMNYSGEIKLGDTYYALRFEYPDFVARGDGTTSGNGLAIDSLIDFDVEAGIAFDPNFSPATFENNKANTPTKCKIEYFRAQSLQVPARLEENLTEC